MIWSLSEWLNNMMFPAAIYLTKKKLYYGAMQGCIEGATQWYNYYGRLYAYHSEEKAYRWLGKAYKEVGIRGYIGRGCMNTWNSIWV